MTSDLHVGYCSEKAARYACERWHYSGTLLPIKNVKYGVWEGDVYKGAVVYSRGVNKHIGTQYGYDQRSAVELTRVALREHQAPVSQIVGITLRMLPKKDRGLRLIVSYADPMQGHLGTIYQAMNWLYVGRSSPGTVYLDYRGRPVHRRTIDMARSRGKDPRDEYTREKRPGKFKYLYPLTEEAADRIEPHGKPYPTEADLGELARRAADA